MSDIDIGGSPPIGQSEPFQSALVPFDFEGQAVRVVSVGGEPCFVLADVCRVLEIENSSRAASRLDDDEKGLHSVKTPGGEQRLNVINESGLYSLILTSRKEAAKRLKKWVTAEVLPAIRKTGGYMVAAPEETPEALALRALTVLQATVERQKAQLAAVQPKADALDRIAEADGSHCITDTAKLLQVRPKDLFAYLTQHSWIYRRTGSDHWCAYQAHIASGDMVHKVTTVLRPDGTEKTTEQVRVTPKGLAKLAKLMAPAVGLVPPAPVATLPGLCA
jgi:prophage antirepressor-like protein